MPLAAIALGISAGSSILGGIFGKKSSDESAEAQERAAALNLQAARQNKAIYYDQAKDAEWNAKHAAWRGTYTAQRLRQQNKVNEQLSAADHAEALRSADVLELAGLRAREFGASQKAQFRLEARDTLDTAAEKNRRLYKEGRGVLGAQRVATAGAGFAEEGTEMDRLVESASRLELARLDVAKEAAGEARRLRYAGEVAGYEGEMAGWEKGEQARATRVSAELSKWQDRVDRWNTEQDALVAIYEGGVEEWNLMNEARDLRRQGDLALTYGMAGYQSGMADAAATRAEGTMGLVSAIGSAAGSYVGWRNRYAGS